MNVMHSNIDFELLDDKTKVYFNDFVKNDVFWGFGIENETYLELERTIDRSYEDIIKNTRRERYSVDYNTNYDLDVRNIEVYDRNINDNRDMKLPIFLNAYGLQTIDLKGQHRTTYEKVPKPNKKFSGKSIFDILKENSNYFEEEHGPGKGFAFDGDTIEFTTRNFYKTNIQKSIKELLEKKDQFNSEYNKVMNKIEPNFRITDHIFNFGFANFYSNPNHTALFNNGTYHINITLPSKLNSECLPLDSEKFLRDHFKAGKIIQWFSPLFVAMYGSSDIYSSFSEKYAFGSQRVCVSRYISIGTFNFDEPIFGKILQMDKEEVFKKTPDNFWLKKIEKHTGYKFSDKIGMDFNMLKHKNLGLEWRIMDMFPYDFLEDFMLKLLLIIDYCMLFNIKNPIYDKEWNKLVFGCITHGWSFIPSKKLVKKFDKLFDFGLYNQWSNEKDKSIYNYFNLIIDYIYYFMEKRGFGKLYKTLSNTIRKPVVYNWNKMKWEKEIDYFFHNYNNLINHNETFESFLKKIDTQIEKEKRGVYKIYCHNMLQIRSIFYLESKNILDVKKYKKHYIYISKI